jgi:hypothetical protein
VTFYLYTGDRRVYPSYDLTVVNGDVIDFLATPAPDFRFSVTTGPATRVFDNSLVLLPPSVPPGPNDGDLLVFSASLGKFVSSSATAGGVLTSAAANATYVTTVTHGATAGTTRPAGAARVFWLGTVAPTNAIVNDRWVDTTIATAPVEKIVTSVGLQVFASLAGSGGGGATPTLGSVADVPTLRALTPTGQPPQQVRSAGLVYGYSTTSTAFDNGTTVVQPTSVSGSNPGRWLRVDPPQVIQPFSRAVQSLAKAKTGQVKVMQIGTSIASFDNSGNKIAVQRLKDRYGDADVNNQAVLFGAIGGSYELPTQGWRKQNYPGLFFVRSRGDNTSSVLTAMTGVGDSVTIWYSKESDGGAFTATIDAATTVNMDSSGAQAFGLSVTTAVAYGNHRIVINPPASGFAYIERIEIGDSTKVGVKTSDVTLGGSSLRNTQIVNAGNTGTATIQPVSTTIGVDAIFNTTEFDLIICHHTVNDSGQYWYSTGWTDLIDRAVATTGVNNVPIVFVVEMAGHNAMPNDAGTASNYLQFLAMREYLLKVARENNHVYTVDWHGMTILSDLTAYQQRYYPGVTALNISAGTYTGDFIHPGTVGQKVCSQALCAALGLGPSEYELLTAGQRAALTKQTPTAPTRAVLSEVGVTKPHDAAAGTALLATGNGISYQRVPYYRDDTVSNLSAVLPGLILASGTSDSFGPYLSLNNTGYVVSPTVDFVNGERVIVTMRLKGTAGGAIGVYPSAGGVFYRNGVALTAANSGAGGTAGFILASVTEPIVFSVEFGATSNSATINFTGADVYEYCVTRTALPTLTSKLNGAFFEIGPPALLSGTDPVFDQALIGQQFYEVADGTTVYKTLRGRVSKWNPTTQTVSDRGLYTAVDRTVSGLLIATYGTPGAATANGVTGGQVSADNTAQGYADFGPFSIVNAYTYTVLLRPEFNRGGVWIWLNGSSNYYLQPDGTWSLTAASARPWNVDQIGRSQAFTFVAPSTLAASIGNTPRLRVQQTGGTNGYSTATVVKGFSACV